MILLFAEWHVTANVQWQTASFFLTCIHYAHMLFHLGYSEFMLLFRPTEFPGTRHSKSSSYISSVNTDSMKIKRKIQRLEKKKKKKVSRTCAWAILYSAQKEQLTGSRKKQWILKRDFFIIHENIPFHEDAPFSWEDEDFIGQCHHLSEELSCSLQCSKGSRLEDKAWLAWDAVSSAVPRLRVITKAASWIFTIFVVLSTVIHKYVNIFAVV